MDNIREYGISVPCPDDWANRTKTCYVRVLKWNDVLLVECNGCDDFHDGEPCASCIQSVKEKAKKENS